MIRAVIDTNVLVSAMIRSSGNEALVLRAVDLRLVTPCVSLKILREYEEVLLPPKFGFAVHEVRSLLTLIRRHGDVFRAAAIPPTSPDPGDDEFIACALSSNAQFLVTGNKRHSRESWLRGTRLVNARELVQHIVTVL